MPFHVQVQSRDGLWSRFTHEPFATREEAENHRLLLIREYGGDESMVEIEEVSVEQTERENLHQRFLAATEPDERTLILFQSMPLNSLFSLVQGLEISEQSE